MIFLASQFILLIGLIIFAYFSWRKIEYGIYGIVFSLPIYLLRNEIFGIPTTALEILIYILFTIWFIKNYQNIDWRKIIPDKMLLIGIILLMAGAVASAFFSVDLRVSAGILKGWFFDPLLVFVILVSVVKNCRQVINILKIFSLSGLAVAAISLLYWFGYVSNGVSYDGRLHGFYSSPNYLAMYLAPALIISVWLFLKGSMLAEGKKINSKEKYFWLIFVLIIAAAIYFSYSYSAWLAITASVFLLIYLMVPTETRKTLFVSVFLLLLLLFVRQAGSEKLENLKNLAYRSSANSRIMIWRSALMIGRDNPVFGIGPGNFQKHYLDYQKKFSEPYLEWAVPQPHNIFLAFWLETGIFGLAGFVMILAWFFNSGILIIKERRLNGAREIAIILLSAAAYILLHGLLDTTYWKNDLAMVFWLVLGLMFVVKRANN